MAVVPGMFGDTVNGNYEFLFLFKVAYLRKIRILFP